MTLRHNRHVDPRIGEIDCTTLARCPNLPNEKRDEQLDGVHSLHHEERCGSPRSFGALLLAGSSISALGERR